MTGKQWFARQKKEQIAQLTCQLDALLPGILRRHAFSKDNPDDFKSQQLSLHAKSTIPRYTSPSPHHRKPRRSFARPFSKPGYID